jgi:hypothetical protein
MYGREIELTSDQEAVVRVLLDWDRRGEPVMLAHLGRQGGKSTILATVHWYAQARARGEPLEDDPLTARRQQ